ncbi:MAG: CHASE2 domain-containing protein, partial [Rhodospirillaceae bacterium]|nr:CHASE2 domain-containing protein [Rhodospirillaceae bacterium]
HRIFAKYILVQALVFGLVLMLHLFNALSFIENEITALKFRILRRDASSELVLVKIDPASLSEIGIWPWPRSYHAAAIDILRAAGAAEIAIDIDFSSRSSEAEDRKLAEALARADGHVVLPVFQQVERHSPRPRVVFTEPLAPFRDHARLASLNTRPDGDGVVRRMPRAELWRGELVPSLVAVLGGVRSPRPEPFYIDFGIRPETVPQISFVDVLRGRFDPRRVRGKRVLIGATAVELGDVATVPVWGAIPGAMLQALATESVMQHRDLHRLPHLAILAGTLMVTLVLVPGFRRWSWREGLTALATISLGLFAVSLAAQSAFPMLLDITPQIMASVLAFATGLISRIDEQGVRLRAQTSALLRQDAIMRRVVDHTFDGLLTIDAAGRILSFNPAAERMFGRPAGEMTGQSFAQLLAEADALGPQFEAAGAFLADVAQRGEPQEVYGRRADGQVFPMDLAVTHIDEADERVFVALVRDISARKRAETLARQAQQRLRDAIESISEAFVLYDGSDRLVLCNGKFRELHREVEELLDGGWRFEDIARAHAELGGVFEAAGDLEGWLARRLERHRDPQGPFEQQTRDGRWFRISERRTMDGGIVGIMTDITEDRRREEELRRAKDEAEVANRAKTEFLANMSHELRTPLNAIIGFADIIKGQLLGKIGVPAYEEYIGDIHQSACHLLQIINDILDIAKIEAGKAELREEEIDVKITVESTMRLMRERASNAGLTMTAEIEDGLPALYADERLVKQILINLLSNAVKFTPAGGSVTIRAHRPAEGGLVMAVCDTGIGIAEDDLARVMEPFGQAGGTLSRRYEGTGLGLPLVNRLITLHGGTFSLESKLGAGTNAIIRFPAERLMARRAAIVSSRMAAAE